MTESEIDQYVGQAIQVRRMKMGLTQAQLGQELGVCFQQVQKYESVTNRVSASKLWLCSQALGAPVESFFPPRD